MSGAQDRLSFHCLVTNHSYAVTLSRGENHVVGCSSAIWSLHPTFRCLTTQIPGTPFLQLSSLKDFPPGNLILSFIPLKIFIFLSSNSAGTKSYPTLAPYRISPQYSMENMQNCRCSKRNLFCLLWCVSSRAGQSFLCILELLELSKCSVNMDGDGGYHEDTRVLTANHQHPQR